MSTHCLITLIMRINTALAELSAEPPSTLRYVPTLTATSDARFEYFDRFDLIPLCGVPRGDSSVCACACALVSLVVDVDARTDEMARLLFKQDLMPLLRRRVSDVVC